MALTSVRIAEGAQFSTTAAAIYTSPALTYTNVQSLYAAYASNAGLNWEIALGVQAGGAGTVSWAAVASLSASLFPHGKWEGKLMMNPSDVLWIVSSSAFATSLAGWVVSGEQYT